MSDLPKSPIEQAGQRGIEPAPPCDRCGDRAPFVCSDCAAGPFCGVCLFDHDCPAAKVRKEACDAKPDGENA